MPHLVKWHDDLSDFGLTVIGLHRQDVPMDELKAKCRLMGIRFPVVHGGEVTGSDKTGIPYCYLFDHTGACVFEGSPDKLEGKLRAAVGASLVADITDPPKSIATIAETLKKGGSPLEALKKLNTQKGDSDSKVSEPAKAIIAKITETAQQRITEAKELAATEPIAAYDLAQLTATRWKGNPLGTQGTELVNKLKSNKSVADELKARPMLETIKKLDTFLSVKVKDESELKSPEFKKAYSAQMKQMTSSLHSMKRSHAEAPATKQAEELTKKYELTTK